jgi:hypothetical protein
MDSLSSASAGYVTFSSMPDTPQRVLNPQQPTYRMFEKAWESNLLNPNQNMVGGRYNTIDTAYLNLCTPTSNYYTTRQ